MGEGGSGAHVGRSDPGTPRAETPRAETPEQRRRVLRLRFGIVGAIAVVGFVLAVMNATSTEWYWQNASTLGIDPGSRVYFNMTMVLLGIAFVGVALPLRRQLAELRDRGLISARWAAGYRVGMSAVAIALVLVGLFHIGGEKLPWLIHDVAGFTIPMVVMAMMLSLKWAIPALGGRFERRSLVVLAAIVGLFVMSVLEVISYSLMEIVSFIICWAWLLRYALRVEALLCRLDRARTSEPATA